jgi:hypothetical protein
MALSSSVRSSNKTQERLAEEILLSELLRSHSQSLREASIRRTVQVLESKRKRIREELVQLILHISLLVPLADVSTHSGEVYTALLQESVQQLGDEAFAELFLQILKEIQ